MSKGYEAADRAETFVAHSTAEHLVDLGEVRMNYATVGDPSLPALLLIPGQTESWWGYELALRLLKDHFQAYAIDLRGQGRTSWTPGRYTFDNMGNDLVRFIDQVIGRPTVVSGLSSGGVLSAWLSAYAKPGQVRGAHYEDPPLFHCEAHPSVGQGIDRGIGRMFAVSSKYLGNQWTVGDWEGMAAGFASEVSPWMAPFAAMFAGGLPQNLKEYDPEWATACWEGTISTSCNHDSMLRQVNVPVFFTHHFRGTDPESGDEMGAASEEQGARVIELVTATGQPFVYRSFPEMGHSMHGQDPALFTQVLTEWAQTLP
ncbi:MAG TPA: alpha/beta hydrolase [Acidimicrobiales bacterium]|jgi:pimeloyl-ACP methyl ester carboxylesterase|nr:alpha/beta hydrolase [Acidimicrobiales bacterium]